MPRFPWARHTIEPGVRNNPLARAGARGVRLRPAPDEAPRAVLRRRRLHAGAPGARHGHVPPPDAPQGGHAEHRDRRPLHVADLGREHRAAQGDQPLHHQRSRPGQVRPGRPARRAGLACWLPGPDRLMTQSRCLCGEGETRRLSRGALRSRCPSRLPPSVGAAGSTAWSHLSPHEAGRSPPGPPPLRAPSPKGTSWEGHLCGTRVTLARCLGRHPRG